MMMRWYDELQRDLRLASRRAARHGTFTAVVIVCLGMGIGATT